MKEVKRIKRPSLMMNLSEGFRAIVDYRQASEFIEAYRATAIGDGHPVLVIPGLLGTKMTTYRLRKFISRLGYRPYDWGLGLNLGNLEDVEKLRLRITQISEKHQSKISIIGWSLGGIYARELAKMQPDAVRQVITLGSPFADIVAPNNAAWIHQWLQGDVHRDPRYTVLLANLDEPAAVPTTAVYSKEDGVVPWEVCREPKEDRFHQNIEVKGSHLGLPNNAAVWYLISDRLRFHEGNWQPFTPAEDMPESVEFPVSQD